MGRGLAYQCRVTPGIECLAIADRRLERAIACAKLLDKPWRVIETAKELAKAIEQGFVAVCEDGSLLASDENTDVFIESTSSILAGGEFVESALLHNKHVVLMNAEVDLIFGPYLYDLAKKNSLVYTSCDGDQHGVIKRLIDETSLWNFEIVMAGNIKGFLDRRSNPTTIIPEADKRNLDYQMATAYTDGTKLNIEMALLANSLGYDTDVTGMHGPRASHVKEVFDLFDFEKLRSRKRPVVDYLLGAEPGGGVYVVGFCDDPYQKEMLAYYKMGMGPFYLFYRPYHLCHVEAMRCIAEAHLDKQALLAPEQGLRTNVFTRAKHELKKGDALDGLGGYHCYGVIENCPPREAPAGLPICLAENVVLRRDIGVDEEISLDDIEMVPSRSDFAMYEKALACSSTNSNSE
jgi:predicted homoserine dehydrogenase-like protein